MKKSELQSGNTCYYHNNQRIQKFKIEYFRGDGYVQLSGKLTGYNYEFAVKAEEIFPTKSECVKYRVNRLKNQIKSLNEEIKKLKKHL